MAVWGSGTAADPWKVTDWDSFVEKCNYESTPSSAITYIVFPTHDQNGNLIPVEERVIDMRHHDWYVDRRDNNSIIVLPSIKDIEGNGWTILGLSLRNSYLFRNNTGSPGSNGNSNRGTNTIIKNLNFQNIYCHGCVYLFNPNANGSRVTVTGCKFSGVSDNSIVDPYATSSGSSAGCICTNTSYSGWNVFTACSFNFKFINMYKTVQYNGGSGGYTGKVEFNNCIFNVEGKIKSTTSNGGSGTSDSAKYNIFFGYFYFCKMTGRLILENAEADSATAYAYLYHNQGGSLNVIDFKLKSTKTNYFNYNYWLIVRTRNSSEVTITYYDYESGFSTVGWNTEYQGTASAFKIPTNRTQMTDKDWLELQGFVIGTAPTT
jgi:hypothetical protein